MPFSLKKNETLQNIVLKDIEEEQQNHDFIDFSYTEKTSGPVKPTELSPCSKDSMFLY